MYILCLFILGIVFLIKDHRELRVFKNKVKPSKGTFLDFGIFLWGLVVIMWLVPSIIKTVAAKDSIEPVLGETQRAVYALCLGLGALLFLIVSFWLQPNFWHNNSFFLIKKIRGLIPKSLKWLLIAMPLIFSVNLLWQGLLSTLKLLGIEIDLSQQDAITAFRESKCMFNTLALAINAVCLAPILEEIIFRMGIYGFLKAKIKPWAAMALSSLIFGAMHGNIAAFLPLCFLGWMLAQLYEHTGCIWSSISLHAAFNTNTLLILWVNPNIL